MKRDLERYRIRFDRWFLETDLHDSGYVAETIGILENAVTGYRRFSGGSLFLAAVL